jgi:protein gp37
MRGPLYPNGLHAMFRLMENSRIAWTHHTENFWLGCDMIAPECAHCYIGRVLRRQHREPWGKLYCSKTWRNPDKWEAGAAANRECLRIFTNSLSDFFHTGADEWRPAAWEIIRRTPHLVYLILTKRPELISKRLPPDWGEGWQNVWLGVSSGCKRTLNKMDALRKIIVHPKALRFLSAEPLLEDIADKIDLTGFGWVIVGGESGSGPQYIWNPKANWRREFGINGRRELSLEWAKRLRAICQDAKVPFFFKQVSAFRSGEGTDALGRVYHEVPPPPFGRWSPKLQQVDLPRTD